MALMNRRTFLKSLSATALLPFIPMEVKIPVTNNLTETFKAQFADPKAGRGWHNDKIMWISWGDYMQWDLASIRSGIISLYDKTYVSEINKDDKNVYYFKYDKRVNWKDLGKHLGVSNSGPSSSSLSSPDVSSTSYSTPSLPSYPWPKRKYNKRAIYGALKK